MCCLKVIIVMVNCTIYKFYYEYMYYITFDDKDFYVFHVDRMIRGNPIKTYYDLKNFSNDQNKIFENGIIVYIISKYYT